MSKIKVLGLSLSADGYGAGTHQTLENPMGQLGMELHAWALATETFRKMFGQSGGSQGIDNDYAALGMKGIGAWIMGRNMFGPIRGPWPNLDWKGWWGDVPPYHVPVYVLTHHAREPLVMEGGTTFYFETNGIEAALKKAKEAAKDKDIRIGGGVGTVKEYLQARHIDEMHLAIGPVILGAGENLWSGINLRELGYEVSQQVKGENAVHLIVRKKA